MKSTREKRERLTLESTKKAVRNKSEKSRSSIIMAKAKLPSQFPSEHPMNGLEREERKPNGVRKGRAFETSKEPCSSCSAVQEEQSTDAKPKPTPPSPVQKTATLYTIATQVPKDPLRTRPTRRLQRVGAIRGGYQTTKRRVE